MTTTDLSNFPGAVLVKRGGAVEEQGADREWDAVSFARGLARSIGQGVMFGFADEAEAYARSILGGETYEEAKKATNAELSQFRGDNPFLAYGLEIGSSMLTPGGILKLASKFPSLAKLAQKGLQKTTPVSRAAIGGGLYGTGTAEEVSDIPVSAGLGTLFGFGGAKLAPAVTQGAKDLISRGIPLSVGQKLGGTVGAIEEGLSRLPIGGSVFGPTRLKAANQFATASYNEALAPLGKKVTAGADPRQAAIEAQKIFSDSYQKALDGVEVDIGSGFIDDVQAVVAPYIKMLDKKAAEKLDDFIVDEIIDRAPGDKLTGESIKDIQTTFGELSNAFMKSTDAYQSALGRAIRAVDAELLDLVAKRYPEKASLLSKTNEAYSMYYPVRAAATSAGVNDNVFSPAKLLSAVRTEEKKLGKAGLNRLERGEGRLQKFAETAQEVIGAKVPESAPIRTAAILAGTGGAAAVDPILTGTGLALAKGLYTKPGQALLSGFNVGGREFPGLVQGVSRAMKTPAAAGLLADKAEPIVSPALSSLLGAPQAQAGSIEDMAAGGNITGYKSGTDRMGNPYTYAEMSDGSAVRVR